MGLVSRAAATLLIFSTAAAHAEWRAPDQPSAAPELSLTDVEHRGEALGDFRGKVTVLHFWATWCATCLRELPSLQRFAADQEGRALRVITIAADSHEATARFVTDHDFLLPGLVDQYGNALHAYRIKALPVSILVDGQGSIRYRINGEARWDEEETLTLFDTLLQEISR